MPGEMDLAKVQRGLTGQYRFRTGWFGVLVLQVEYFFSTVMPAYSRHVVTETRWRDATLLDISDSALRGLIAGGYADASH